MTNWIPALAVLFLISTAPATALAETAAAAIKGTSARPAIEGSVRFEESDDGLLITADLQNAPPGKHGFHIHEFGSCDGDGSAAGGHFNPEEAEHGDLAAKGLDNAHAGDLGNLTVGEDGSGSYETLIYDDVGVSNAIYNIAGRAVILHEKEDDFGQPTGNAGGRIACGVILIRKD